MAKNISFLRGDALNQKSPFSKPTRWRRVRDGLHPPPVHITGRLTAYIERELDAVNEALAAGCTEDEIRSLVSDLVAARKIAS